MRLEREIAVVPGFAQEGEQRRVVDDAVADADPVPVAVDVLQMNVDDAVEDRLEPAEPRE